MTAALLFQVATVLVCPCAAGEPPAPPVVDFHATYCAGPGFSVTWGGDPDLVLDLYVIGPAAVEWEGQFIPLDPGQQFVRPAALWPGYLDTEYRAGQARGEHQVLVTVCGQFFGAARVDAPASRVVYPTDVRGRW